MRGGYSKAADAPKLVFVRPLVSDARARLTRPALLPADRHGGSKLMLSADDMRALPAFFYDIDDPRRAQGRRHSLPTVLALANAPRLLALNRGHWTVEAVHHILDNAWDEDRSRIRTGHGPENTSRLRRFAIGVIHAHSRNGVAAAQRRLHRNPRLVFDYLKMTKNTLGPPPFNPQPDRRTN